MSLVFSSELSLSSLKYKSDVVFSVSISTDQNLIKLEKRSIISFNNLLNKISPCF